MEPNTLPNQSPASAQPTVNNPIAPPPVQPQAVAQDTRIPVMVAPSPAAMPAPAAPAMVATPQPVVTAAAPASNTPAAPVSQQPVMPVTQPVAVSEQPAVPVIQQVPKQPIMPSAPAVVPPSSLQTVSSSQPTPTQPSVGALTGGLAEATAPTPVNNAMIIPPSAHVHRKYPVKAITLALIVMTVLCAIAVAGYIKTKDSSIDSSSVTPNPSTAATKTSTVSSSDVDSESAAIDASLKTLDDTTDFASSELTDAALGL